MITPFKTAFIFMAITTFCFATELSSSSESEFDKPSLREIQIISGSPDWNFAFEHYTYPKTHPFIETTFIHAEKHSLQSDNILNRINIIPVISVTEMDRDYFFIRYRYNEMPNKNLATYDRFIIYFDEVKYSIVEDKLMLYFNHEILAINIKERLNQSSK